MARTPLASYRGGRVDDDTLPEDAQKAPRYPCAANGCRMPGAIFPAAGADGVCAWHYGANSTDWPRITRCLAEWECVTFEINEARRAMTGELAAKPAALAELFAAAWARLWPLLGDTWSDELTPRNGESYSRWSQRLEAFLGGQVVGQLRTQLRRAA